MPEYSLHLIASQNPSLYCAYQGAYLRAGARLEVLHSKIWPFFCPYFPATVPTIDLPCRTASNTVIPSLNRTWILPKLRSPHISSLLKPGRRQPTRPACVFLAFVTAGGPAWPSHPPPLSPSSRRPSTLPKNSERPCITQTIFHVGTLGLRDRSPGRRTCHAAH